MKVSVIKKYLNKRTYQKLQPDKTRCYTGLPTLEVAVSPVNHRSHCGPTGVSLPCGRETQVTSWRMAESVVRVLSGKGTSLTLTSRGMKELPVGVSALTNLSALLLNNNSISSLPCELLSLRQVSLHLLIPPHSSSVCWNISKITPRMCYTARRFVIKYFSLCDACKLAELNLGNNSLKELPAVLGHLESLKKLYLFGNQITVVPPEVIGGFSLFRMISILEVFEMECGEEEKAEIRAFIAGNVLQAAYGTSLCSIWTITAFKDSQQRLKGTTTDLDSGL